jgi:hypothetical protein
MTAKSSEERAGFTLFVKRILNINKDRDKHRSAIKFFYALIRFAQQASKNLIASLK